MYDFEDSMDSDTSTPKHLYSDNGSVEEFVIDDNEDNRHLSFDLSIIDWPIVFKVDYILFGTFMSYCRSLELNRHFLKMTAISPNIRGIGFKYDINLVYNDIKQIKYCCDRNNPLVFIELNQKSNHLIQTAMNLGDNSPDGLRFDVDADDIVERYIVVDLSDEDFGKLLIECAKDVNNNIVVKPMFPENAKRYLRQNNRKCVAKHRLTQTIADTNQLFGEINHQFSPQMDNFEEITL